MKWETLKFGKWHSDTDARGRTGDEERKGDDESEKWSREYVICKPGRCRVIGEVKWLLLSALTTTVVMRWAAAAWSGPGEGAAASPLFITESRNSSPRKWPKRYHAARFKEPITKQRGNLETNCDAFKFPTSNTRDGSVPQVDYVRLALPWQPVQCAFQVEFLNFYIDVHNIWEGTFAFSIFTICGGDAFSNFL